MNYIGPKVRRSRALGVALTPKAAKIMARRPNPPGQHGATTGRRPSTFALQLREKQKLRFQFNVSERQLRNAVAKAKAKGGDTGEALLAGLGLRLDAVVLHAGMAITTYQARQFVNHGLVLVNGQRLNIPSAQLRPGDVVVLKPKAAAIQGIAEAFAQAKAPPYLERADQGVAVKVARWPGSQEVPCFADLALVVEWYARRL